MAFLDPNQPPVPGNTPPAPGMGTPTPPTPSAASDAMLTEQQIRTMRSDLSGGAAPAATEPALNIPPTTGTPTFDADEPAFTPNGSTNASVDQMITAGTGKKKLWLMLGSVVGLLALGAVGYLYVYPMLTAPAEAPTTVPPGGSVPVGGVTPPSQTAELPAGYASVFINPAIATIKTVITDAITGSAVQASFVRNSQNPQVGVTEIIFVNQNNTLTPFASLIAAVLPTIDQKTTTDLFEGGATTFVYKDEMGSWPGYIAKLKPTFTQPALNAWLSAFEKLDLKGMFIVSPGTLSAWKSGTVGKYADRYAPATTPGASASYLLIPEKSMVVISTSFDGLKEALRLMGL